MKRIGFTLVELLVVIAIIGVLMGLLLPAVQNARESARQMQCGNNLKQMATAAMSHLSMNMSYPSGGFGRGWEGDPDCGAGDTQPGGWTYSLLPFMEQTVLWDLGSDGVMSESDGVRSANVTRAQTPVGIFYCPSRRRAKTYPGYTHGFNSNSVSTVCKLDYAGNSANGIGNDGYDSGRKTYSAQLATESQLESCRGIVFFRSAVTSSDIYDGASSTYLYGEKYVDANRYEAVSGQYAAGDDHICWTGSDDDNCRGTGSVPVQDRRGYNTSGMFGSAHTGVFGMSMADGSVHRVNYSIDSTVHNYLGQRNDEQTFTLPF
ncbi:MAG: DUF1559 domain-containing protein [Thermoguttaceae bacterium]|nr:DUF1559 domain-containing protein [Thermoguttaceae bacterium]